MAKYEFSRMTPERRAECGRKGGIANGKTHKRRREMRETLDILLNMPTKKGKVYDAEEIQAYANLKGKNLTIDQAMMVGLVQKALKGDLNAIAMVRDTVGEKPAEKVNVDATVKNPFDELTADELRELIKRDAE